MKCLSLWQPWASAVALGKKQVETRSWSTRYRGPLLIHAARTVSGLLAAVQDVRGGDIELWRRVLGVPDGELLSSAFNRLPYGAIIARTTLVDVVATNGTAPGEMSETYDAIDETALGDYSYGRFAWILGDVEALSPVILRRGHQALFDVPDEVLR